jgi:hypothetical protein
MAMNDDERCCGSGTCIIDPAGRCWCGQQWDGEKMVAGGVMRAGDTPKTGIEDAHAPSASSADSKD